MVKITKENKGDGKMDTLIILLSVLAFLVLISFGLYIVIDEVKEVVKKG